MGEQTIFVARGWGDGLVIEVPISCLSGLHMATAAGGTLRPLPRPTLAAYMDCTAIPDGAEFGHSCLHGPPPHRIKVLIFQAHNDRGTYKKLRASITGTPRVRS
jgi:hypothetical protein